jgi:hypothetical protein
VHVAPLEQAGVRKALLLLLLLAGCATPTAPIEPPGAPLGWICQRNYPGEGHQFWVNADLDSNGRPTGYSAGWRASAGDTPGTDLFWHIPETGPWHSKPDFVSLGFTLPRAPREAVQARLYADSRLLAQREIIDRRTARSVRRSARVGGNLFLGPGAGPVPLLHGVRSLEIILEENGVEIARLRLPLPDWAELDRQIAEALPALAEDARDFESRCERESEPEI